MDEDAVRKRMNEVLDLVVSEIASIRTGGASSALVGDLEVTVYGGQQKLKLNELATITIRDPRTILVDPWDKSIVGEIKKGILSANVGINPSVDGEIIRISIPPMTSEDRQKFTRLLSAKIENGKIMIRQIRGDAMRDIKRLFEEKELSEDEKFGREKLIQEITDEFTDKIVDIGKKKEEELMQI